MSISIIKEDRKPASILICDRCNFRENITQFKEEEVFSDDINYPEHRKTEETLLRTWAKGHENQHKEYDNLIQRFDSVKIGSFIQGIIRRYVYHTEPDELTPFKGQVTNKKNTCHFPNRDKLGLLIKFKNGSAKWIDFLEIEDLLVIKDA